jgi:cellulose biosynthesis protein BcsQ
MGHQLMLKVAIWNLKGGCSKSATALNLGDYQATLGKKTLLLDLDGQRTLSFSLGMDGATPPDQRVYPQHLIQVAIDLLNAQNIDWTTVRNEDELRQSLNL